MKMKILGDVKEFLNSMGFDTFVYRGGCFDLAARRDRFILLKVLTNVDSFQKEQAKDLKLLSRLLEAHCFLIGNRTRKETLDTATMYERFGIPTMAIETFKETIGGKPPERLRTRGGLFAKLKPRKLRELRKERDMTQEELAEKIGVSQKNISEHESGKERVFLSVVSAMEELFGERLRQEVDPFGPEKMDIEKGKKAIQGGMLSILKGLGISAHPIQRAPPHYVMKHETVVLSRQGVGRGLKTLAEFSRISGSEAFVVSEENEERAALPVIKKEELKELDGPGELIKVLKERKENT